jgi:LacI family transcriptional regulator
MSNSITLRDVATQAGVSMGTASQALNNRSNVAPETRRRVVDAAVALGYPLKEAVSNGGSASLSVIGILTKHDLGLPIEISPFYSYVQAGVESECRRRNISLMYASVEVDSTSCNLAHNAP